MADREKREGVDRRKRGGFQSEMVMIRMIESCVHSRFFPFSVPAWGVCFPREAFAGGVDLTEGLGAKHDRADSQRGLESLLFSLSLL